jgi:hypothetical protein
VQYVKIDPSNHKTIPTIIFPLTSMTNHSLTSFSFVSEKELVEILESKIFPQQPRRTFYNNSFGYDGATGGKGSPPGKPGAEF